MRILDWRFELREFLEGSKINFKVQHKMEKIGVKTYSTWYKIQSYFNTLNHIFNGSVACFMTIYLMKNGIRFFTMHVFLTTVGYQLLMTEAIMVFYTPNSWTFFHSYKTKKHLHWILQLIATIFIITGNCFFIALKKNLKHFNTIHGITGKNC